MKPDTLNEEVGILTRREIEARILKPFFAAVSQELGTDKAEALLREIVVDAAKGVGGDMRARADGEGLEAFAAQWEPWFRGGALEVEVLEQTDTTWAFNVTRCRYAELYRALGMADLGATLSCNRDAALIQGYDSSVTFERTQTLMEGSSCCDFRYTKKAEG